MSRPNVRSSQALLNANDEKSVNVLDIVKYLLFYWRWFVLVIILFVCYFFYQYSKSPFIYQQSMSVMIKTPVNSQLSMKMSRFSGLMAPVSVTNEILQFKSKELMKRVVSKLHANVSYTVHEGLRDNELYKNAPIRVAFDDTKDGFIMMTVVLHNAEKATLTLWPKSANEKSYLVKLNVPVNIGGEKMTVYATENLGASWYGRSIRVQRLPAETMAASFSSNLSISQTKDDASIIDFSLNDFSATRAADVLNELVATYNQQTIEDKTRIAANTEAFIRERLGIIESELGNVESQIEEKQVANGGEDISAQGGKYISQSDQYEDQSKEIATQIRLNNMVKQYLMNSSKVNDLIPSNIGLEDVNVVSQINQYNSVLLKRNRLREGGNDRNPAVAELNNTLKELRRSIIAAINNSYSNLSVRKKDATEQGSIARSKAVQVPGRQRQMLSIERQQKVKEDLYIFLLNKREENSLSRVQAEDNAQLVDPPAGSYSPIAPTLYKKLLMGVGCGILLPAVVLLVILMLDTNVRTRKEIEDAVDVPFLAQIPFAKDAQMNKNQISIRSQGHDALSESFRILRTNLGFLGVDTEPQRVITFTSFSPGAGKTFTSVNVAASLTQINKKVVVVDLDLRKGTLSNNANVKHVKGITHYLADTSVTLDDVLIHDAPSEGIDMVPIGIIAPNPVELLLSKRLDQLISELKARYDYIVVDNVPLGVVADTVIINRITDITIFVVRSGKLDRRQLPELQRIYEEKRLTNMAVLLNGIKPSGHSYGYGYGYGSYGYGYGTYGGEDEQKPWWKFWRNK